MKRLQLKTFLNKIFSCTPFQKYHASPLLYNFNKHTLLLSFSYVLFYINTYFVYLNYWFISSYFRIEIKRLFFIFLQVLITFIGFFFVWLLLSSATGYLPFYSGYKPLFFFIYRTWPVGI